MATLKDAIQNTHAKIIDVRTTAEHAEQSLKTDHILAPLQDLKIDELTKAHHLSSETPLYFLCRAGARAANAASMFRSKGFTNCHVIDGGILACDCQDISTNEQAQKIIPLDGQVRMVIGAVLIALSLIGINGAFGAFYTILGLGLVLMISGYTGWCGLAMILARAPWNQRPKA